MVTHLTKFKLYLFLKEKKNIFYCFSYAYINCLFVDITLFFFYWIFFFHWKSWDYSKGLNYKQSSCNNILCYYIESRHSEFWHLTKTWVEGWTPFMLLLVGRKISRLWNYRLNLQTVKDYSVRPSKVYTQNSMLFWKFYSKKKKKIGCKYVTFMRIKYRYLSWGVYKLYTVQLLTINYFKL